MHHINARDQNNFSRKKHFFWNRLNLSSRGKCLIAFILTKNILWSLLYIQILHFTKHPVVCKKAEPIEYLDGIVKLLNEKGETAQSYAFPGKHTLHLSICLNVGA